MKRSDSPILVLGDVMADVDVHVEAVGISDEAPVPVLDYVESRLAPGGAASVAASIAGAGRAVVLIGLLGQDTEGDELERVCRERGIVVQAVRDDRTTTRKQRTSATTGDHLARVDREDTRPMAEAMAAKVEQALIAALDGGCRVVVASDYAKGFWSEALAARVVERVRGRGRVLIVDAKPKHLPWFAGASCFTPNVQEAGECARLLRIDGDDPSALATGLSTRLGGAVLVTRGAEGMTLGCNGEAVKIPSTLHGSTAQTAGAGDVVVAALAVYAAEQKEPQWETGARQAAMAVARAIARPSGTCVLTAGDLTT